MTKENKNWTSIKHFAPKLNILNHNICIKMNIYIVLHVWQKDGIKSE